MKTPDILTLEDYLDLPDEQRARTVWFWPMKWYTEPYALKMGEWEKFHEYVKHEYPVQFFIRDTLYIRWIIFSNDYRSAKRWIQYRFVHPRKEMIQNVFPPDRQDLDSIIVKFCLECIVEYVEREKCFEHIAWDGDEERIQQAAMIKEIYEYATSGRITRGKEINLLWDDVPTENAKLDDYHVIGIKEKEIEDLDTKYCNWVINNRSRLWT